MLGVRRRGLRTDDLESSRMRRRLPCEARRCMLHERTVLDVQPAIRSERVAAASGGAGDVETMGRAHIERVRASRQCEAARADGLQRLEEHLHHVRLTCGAQI